jgi:glycosyltransferase involved in cell wall biosynthesis
MLEGAAAIQYTTLQELRLAEMSLGATRGVVIPLGVEEQLFATPETSPTLGERSVGLYGQPYVLALGRLHPKKKLDLLVDVFLEVTDDAARRDWRLVIAGDGDAQYVAGLKRLVADRQATERVLFSGWLGGQERTAVLHGAALMALPSQQENFGLVVVESMASGVPVLISTAVNLAEEINAAQAGWVSPLDRASLAQTLVEALESPAERQRRGALGRELARRQYTWPRVADQLRQLYGALAG